MPRRSTVHRLSAAAVAAAGALVAGVLAAPPAYAATVSIADVQGSALLSPLAGQSATVEGVVTGDHRTGGYRGIYVQTEGSGGATDATPGRSDGIFVFVGNRTFDLAIGDCFKIRKRVLSSVFRVHPAIEQEPMSANLKIVRIRPDLGMPCEICEFQMRLR